VTYDDAARVRATPEQVDLLDGVVQLGRGAA
jgi:hypothetical protein